MATQSVDSESHPVLGKLVREYHANRTDLSFNIVLFAAVVVGLAWGISLVITTPKADRTTSLFSALFLASWLLAAVAGIVHYWHRCWQRYRLHEGGLEYISGGHSTPIAWDEVAEIYEVVSSATMIGFTVEKPKREVDLVTEDGTYCFIDKYVFDFQSLAPVVADSVNDSLRKRAAALLRSNQSVPLGPLIVSADGIHINKMRPKPYPRNFEVVPLWRQVKIRPGEYAWTDIAEICVRKVRRENETFYRMEILGQGRLLKTRFFAAPVARVANFAVLCEVLTAVGHPPRFQQ